ncbi:M3 family oligoendopeptidase [Lacticaseibacillus kribbianus]|uniref:M3 family oligoendopeptidase n=1 Tax=Lacticaseibacillus kribbianus TaxID=2926292 RepID=UPI001CD6DB67|nr:M3 family oligoendopeptidase [Lacticaseibacillus kribbianus]
MDFTQVTYKRPNSATYLAAIAAGAHELAAAKDADAAVAVASRITDLINDTESMGMIAQIRHTIDTRDAFYAAEDEFWNDFGPQADEAQTAYLKAVLDSPFKEALGTLYPKPYFLKAKNLLQTNKPEVIALQQKANALASAYTNLIASAQVDFNGQTYTLAQLGPLRDDADRAVRKGANEAYWGFFAAHEAEFDKLYDDMVHTRTAIAQKLGFKDFSEMSYVFMDRFDYDEEMVATYRHEVQTKVVPLVLKQRAKQAKRLGLDHLAYYDLGVQFKSGNATPEGTAEELVAAAQQMYHEMSPEAGDFFDHMISDHLLDLLAKPGKASGGYAEYIPAIRSPFIFANFNGTSGDVDVLTHEAGHAFQTYLAKWIRPGDCVFPTFEAAEIFSMSMEFIAYPWMSHFFGKQTAKYKYAHLQAALEFLPYGILVDLYQHQVYTHPDWTPAERKAEWRRLEKLYNPDKDYAENPDLERGIYWMRQGHIFESPFYYIDYTIAQVVAYQFWKRFNVDHDPKAWTDYETMAKAGGSQTLLELLATGHLRSPFAPGALDELLAAIQQALDAVDDASL